MTTFLFSVFWYLSGCIGSALWLEFAFRRHRTWPLDIKVADLFFGALLAIFGPINLGVGIAFTIVWLLSPLVAKFKFNGDRVVWLLSPLVAKFKFNGDRVVFKRHEN